MNSYDKLIQKIITTLEVLKDDTKQLNDLIHSAVTGNTLVIVSTSEFLLALSNSKINPDVYTMRTLGCYLIFNSHHKYLYIRQSAYNSKRANSHLPKKFQPDPKSSELSNKHTCELKFLNMDIKVTIKFIPIFIIPALIEFDKTTSTIISNLIWTIERLLIYEATNTGFKLYNWEAQPKDSQASTLITPDPAEAMDIEQVKNYTKQGL